MAISVQDPVLAWRRVANYAHSLKPVAARQLKALKEQLVAYEGNPNLQFVPFDALSSTDVVIADAACTLYALVMKLPGTTATFTKLTDHASTGSDDSSELVIKGVGAAKDVIVLTFPNGIALANGATMQGTTTASGGTGSSTNGASGFALIGPA